jgi:parallel beta-helix repeat protein
MTEIRKVGKEDILLTQTDNAAPESWASTEGTGLTKLNGNDIPWSNEYSRTIRPGDIVTKGPWVDVRAHGAIGDGVTDDTAAIQAALDAATSGAGCVLFPAGTYMINSEANTYLGEIYGVMVKSNTEVYLSPGATLKAITNNATHYSVLAIFGSENVLIHGKGIIQGERDTHTGSTGEWGHALDIKNSDKVIVKDIHVKDAWGDGVYVGSTSTSGVQSTEVHLIGIRSSNNRRNNFSITDLDGGSIVSCWAENANGTNPQAGFDFEPNASGSVKSISVVGNTARDNTRHGFVTVGDAGSVFRIKFTNNSSLSNGLNGIEIQNSNYTVVEGNTTDGNTGDGIFLDRSDFSIVNGNYIANNDYGVHIYNGEHNIINGNSIRMNGKHGIFLEEVSQSNTISSNLLYGNGQDTDNTYDNINIDTNSDDNNVKGNILRQGTGETNQSRYGINVVVSTCENNEITGNDITGGGQTGGFNDAGTGTIKFQTVSIVGKGTEVYDFPSIADGSFESKNIAIPGAALGDLVLVSFSLDTQDLQLTAVVVSADTITCTLYNQTGSAVDLDEGTITAWVFKNN